MYGVTVHCNNDVLTKQLRYGQFKPTGDVTDMANRSMFCREIDKPEEQWKRSVGAGN
jgi:hypothetical protein